MPVQEQERLQVLKMIDAGTITVDEAFRLLDALDRSAGPENTVVSRLATKALAGKVVRLKVSNLHSGRVKAQAQLPVQLLELGLRIGSQYAPGVKAIDVDELVAGLANGVGGKIVEVTDHENRIRVEVLIE